MKRVIVALAAVVVLIGAGRTMGAITYRFTGHITSLQAEEPTFGDIGTPTNLPFAVDDTFSGSFTYDRAVPDDNPDDEYGTYKHTSPYDFGLEWMIGDTLFGTVRASDQSSHVYVANHPAGTEYEADGFGIYQTGSENLVLPTGWAVETATGFYSSLSVSFGDSSDTAFADDSLPKSLSLSDFDGASIKWNVLHDDYPTPLTLTTPLGSELYREFWFHGEIDGLTAVPEPSTLVMWAGLLLCGLGWRRCRRHKRANEHALPG